MITNTRTIAWLAVFIVLTMGALDVTALTTEFTYQGELANIGQPANGAFDFEFKLFPVESAGTQLGSTVSLDDVQVTEGRFTVTLDFGRSEFIGVDRWLEIAVRPGASSEPTDFVTLAPRQPLTPTPYALHTWGIVVDENENVGLGTNAPQMHLEVARLTFNAVGTATARMGVTGQVRDVIGPPLGTQWVYLNCDANSHSNADASLVRNSGADLLIGTNGAIGGALTAQLVVTSDGRVGIGTSDPSTTLDVAGSVEIAGRLGIGTPSPDVKLQVLGGTDSDPTGGGYIVLGPATADNLSLDTNEIMALNNGAGTTLHLNHNGGTVAIGAASGGSTRLGIGTASPSERLDLGGGNIAMGYEIVTNSGTEVISVDVNCPAGKRVLGGGCFSDQVEQAWNNNPKGSTGWNCAWDDDVPGEATVYAICANIR